MAGSQIRYRESVEHGRLLPVMLDEHGERRPWLPRTARVANGGPMSAGFASAVRAGGAGMASLAVVAALSGLAAAERILAAR